MAAGICLQLTARVVGDDIVPLVMPFVTVRHRVPAWGVRGWDSDCNAQSSALRDSISLLRHQPVCSPQSVSREGGWRQRLGEDVSACFRHAAAASPVHALALL